MGEVEQMRMSAPGTATVDTLTFRHDPAVELTLRRDVLRAEANLSRYLHRKAVATAMTNFQPQPEDNA